MRQTMTTEVRPDEGEAKNYSAMTTATDRLGRSQHPSWARLLPGTEKNSDVVFARAAIRGISAKKSFTRGSARSKATVSVVCGQAAFNNTLNRRDRERVSR
jgi:hypothetical protein